MFMVTTNVFELVSLKVIFVVVYDKAYNCESSLVTCHLLNRKNDLFFIS